MRLANPALAALLALAAPAAHAAPLINLGCDGLNGPGAIHLIAPGVANGPLPEHPDAALGGGVILIDLIDELFCDTTASGDSILARRDTCGRGDHPPTIWLGSVAGVLTEEIEQVALDVIDRFGGSGATFALIGFDADGANATGKRRGHWEDLGGELLGSAGYPTLVGSGPLTAGSVNQVMLRHALPGASAWFVLGLGLLDAPLEGGVLVPTPDVLLGPLTVDGAGTATVPFTWPANVPGGATLYSQSWIADPAGPKGYAASHGLAAVAP